MARNAKLKVWLVFGAIQGAGLVLPLFANVHSNIVPLLAGICLLLPGSAVAFIFPSLDGWLMAVLILAINAAICCVIVRFGDIELLRD